jgi:hypothetical protein
MADANSTIRVNIVGDTKGLQTELGKADKGITTMVGNAGKLVGAFALGAAAAGLADFAKSALSEADRLADATGRLESHLGDLSGALIDTADDFTDLGQSTQDILELEASFADFAVAVGLSDEAIARFAPKAAEAAAAMALITDLDPATVIDLIGKAAAGSERAMRELGVNLDEAAVQARALQDSGKDTPDQLTDAELAAAAYAEVLDQLAPRLADVTEGTGDVESKTAELQAKWETLTGKIGQGLEGPMNDLLDWILSGVDGLGMLDEFMGYVEQSFRDLLGPIARATDELATFLETLSGFDAFGSFDIPTRTYGGGGGGGGSGYGGGGGGNVTLNVVPKDSADTERAVIEALKDYEARNGSRAL